MRSRSDRYQVRNPTRHVRILQEEGPDPWGNARFVDQIIRHAPPNVEHLTFNWRRAFLGSYDVIHFHWPEFLIRHPTRFGRFRRRIRFLTLLISLRLRGVHIVRTLHNTEPHEPGDKLEGLLLGALEQQTDLFIRLNPYTNVPRGQQAVMIPHGDYREAFSQFPRHSRIRGRVLFAGSLRPYKGIDELLSAFGGIKGEDVSLRIVGQPQNRSLATLIAMAVANDHRISRVFGFLPDEYLVKELREAELVILPYQHIHNSGVLFAALSVNTPVLAPDTNVHRWIADEIGPGWLHLYQGGLTPSKITQTLASIADDERRAPNLSQRDWQSSAEMHTSAYLSLNGDTT